MERTYIKDLPSQIGEIVKLQGWAENIRNLGKVAFVDLRDRTGSVQCVAVMKANPEVFEVIKETTIESVIELTGKINKRPEAQINGESQTGMVEIEISDYTILNKTKALPIPVQGDGYSINEESRLKYRYLDLRRNRMHKNMVLRSEYIRSMRDFLYAKDFVEVETPMLTEATMEGARDFIVPSRLQPGKFYALPQSPQQYKQLLMTAGIERYFQVARCIRDENLRADRGFEFAQLDLEMSFVKREDVMELIENLVKTSVKKMGGVLKDEKFPVIDYKDAMARFGADKFDLRTEEEKKNGTLAFAWVINFPFFKKVDKEDAAEVRDSKSGWTFTHNPFSMPIDEHIEWLKEKKNINQILTTQYDLVCNGLEVGGGSIRAHKSELLRATYEIMGYSEEEIQKSVGHMLDAFDLGTPPHGGIALGLDRHIALLSGEGSIKETFAFPMTYNGRVSVMNAPCEVDPKQLKELGLELKVEGKKSN